jgi:renalase
MKHIAIVGAGIAGVTLARELGGSAEITLFEKYHRVGGRMSHRSLGEFSFDHGAQYFTARSLPFQHFLAPFIRSGLVAEWQPRVLTLAPGEKPYVRDWFEPHYVAVPHMPALCEAVSHNLDIKLNATVTAIRKQGHSWHLLGDTGDLPGQYDWVIATAPVNQTLGLLREHLAETALSGENGLESVTMSPCYALMLGFDTLLDLPFDAAKVKHMGIEWIMVNASKPGRPSGSTLVIHSSNQWAQAHLDAPDAWVIQRMRMELDRVLGHELPEPRVMDLKRWVFARVEKALEPDYLLDIDNQLAACGDWCLYDRVEGAYLSAISLARRLGELL